MFQQGIRLLSSVPNYLLQIKPINNLLCEKDQTPPKLCIINNINSNFDINGSLKVKWQDLQGKLIMNENILIVNFGDVHPFPKPPTFTHALNVYLYLNYKYWHYYWLNQKIFPTNPTIYLNGHPCDSPVLNRGFKINVVGNNNYNTAIRYANEIAADTSLISNISEDTFKQLIHNHTVEEVICKHYYQENDEFSRPLNKENFNGVFSDSIMKNTGW